MPPLALHEALSGDGFIRVDSAFLRSDAEAMADLMWDVFANQFGILKSEPSTWKRPFRKGALDQIGNSPLFWNIFSEDLISVIDDLLGDGCWELPERLGAFLITFPNTASWELPDDSSSQCWHSDEGPEPGLMTFVFLNQVDRFGGGTLVVRGSHRLPAASAAEEAMPDAMGRKWKDRWTVQHECEWLRQLRSPGDPVARYKRFVEMSTEVNGVPLQVVELTGEPGDIVLCHPRLVHAVAPNASGRPRFMRTPRIRGVAP
jgi:hypothetical protein